MRTDSQTDGQAVHSHSQEAGLERYWIGCVEEMVSSNFTQPDFDMLWH